MTFVDDDADVPAREQLQRAFNRFSELVHRVPDDAWQHRTPCSQWSVRELVNHMTAEHLWAPRLLAGEGIAEVGDAYDGDVLGDDPAAAWHSAASRSRQSWSQASDSATVQLSFGNVAVAEYAEQMLLDLTVHAWDLARGAGLQDADKVVPQAVLHVLRYVRGRNLPGGALFGPPVHTDSADPQDQLVALLGRDPAEGGGTAAP